MLQKEELSDGQSKALALIALFSAVLSACGSALLVFIVMRTKGWHKELHHRLIVWMSCIDIVISLIISPQGFTVPSETDLPWAIGNDRTCKVSGFFFQFGHCIAYYNMALSLCYLLKCVHGWTEERLKKYEIPFHIVGLGLPLLVAVGALFLDFYHAWPLSRGCGVAAYPRGCSTNGIKCTEGEYAPLYIWAVSFPVGFPPFIVSGVSTGMIYLAVRKQEKRSKRHAFPGSTNEHADRKLNAVFAQCVFYILVVINMVIWCTILRILELFHFGPQNEACLYPIVVMSQLSCRSQGLPNLLVYLRPRYLARRERGQSRWVSLLNAMEGSASTSGSISRNIRSKGKKSSKATSATSRSGDGDLERSPSENVTGGCCQENLRTAIAESPGV